MTYVKATKWKFILKCHQEVCFCLVKGWYIYFYHHNPSQIISIYTYNILYMNIILGYLFCVFTLDFFGRKKILAFSQILTGSTCILAALLPSTIRPLIITLTLVGKFGASAAFSIVYVYTAEMFHTPVR